MTYYAPSRRPGRPTTGYMGHLLMENRNALIVDAPRTRASGTAEREAALAMPGRRGRWRGVTLGPDKAYDVERFQAISEYGKGPALQFGHGDRGWSMRQPTQS